MRLELACRGTDRTPKYVLDYNTLYARGLVLSFLSEAWLGAFSVREERERKGDKKP